jgi:polysaccharide biosynthesis/export protein
VRNIKLGLRCKVILSYTLLLSIEASFSAVAQDGAQEPGAQTEEPCRRYALGPFDQIVVRGLSGERINETLTVASDGSITLPLVGRMIVAGAPAEDLQRRLNDELKFFVLEPNVSVSLEVPQSRHISVVGAVNQPGVHVIRGCTTLIDAISRAGGLRQDAGNTIKITRSAGRMAGKDSLRAGLDGGADYQVIDIRLSDLLEAHHPEANVVLQPDDTISVPRAQLVYVVGAVQRAGGFPLNERNSISVLQVLSLAGGLAPAPAARWSRIIRGPDTKRTEIGVDVTDILNGKHPDVLLQPNDILFIPSSTTKKAAMRTLEAVIQTATGLAIWRR